MFEYVCFWGDLERQLLFTAPGGNKEGKEGLLFGPLIGAGGRARVSFMRVTL